MKKRSTPPDYALPAMMTELAFASWETIFHRTMLMAQGTCTPAEFLRMSNEKTAAMQHAVAAVLTGKSQAAVVAPFLTRARANARRLRTKA